MRKSTREKRKQKPKRGLIKLVSEGDPAAPPTEVRDLPKDWEKRRVGLFKGKHLKFLTLGRMDLLRSKLFAFCDRQQDYQDCLALKPTAAELRTIYPWLRERDGNELWPAHVARSLQAVAKELGHELDVER